MISFDTSNVNPFGEKYYSFLSLFLYIYILFCMIIVSFFYFLFYPLI